MHRHEGVTMAVGTATNRPVGARVIGEDEVAPAHQY